MMYIWQPVLCLLHVVRQKLHRREFILSCVSVDVCCWGCITLRVTRGRDLGRGTMLVFVQRSEWRQALSDRSRLTTIANLVVEVKRTWTAGMHWREVSPPWTLFTSLCLCDAGIWRFWKLSSEVGLLCVDPVQFGGNRGLGSWRFAWGEKPCSVLWQGYYWVWKNWKKVSQKEAQWKACVECD